MTIDHDAIAARARDHIARGGSPYIAPSEYLDLYDEVTRLRADLRHVIDERDATFALMLARAEEAEAERDRLRAALTIYAQSGNWQLGGCCDPNSPNFTGDAIARAALKGDSDA